MGCASSREVGLGDECASPCPREPSRKDVLRSKLDQPFVPGRRFHAPHGEMSQVYEAARRSRTSLNEPRTSLGVAPSPRSISQGRARAVRVTVLDTADTQGLDSGSNKFLRSPLPRQKLRLSRHAEDRRHSLSKAPNKTASNASAHLRHAPSPRSFVDAPLHPRTSSRRTHSLHIERVMHVRRQFAASFSEQKAAAVRLKAHQRSAFASPDAVLRDTDAEARGTPADAHVARQEEFTAGGAYWADRMLEHGRKMRNICF
ncbi:unnamed protein product [Pedinophyceae sp. YPF-701]|nr:unnamed protein product [Pedinophyceae sp. YPF-701]